MQRRKIPIILSVLASISLLTTLLLLLGSARTQAAPLPAPHTGPSNVIALRQETYTPVVTIKLPTANAVLNSTHLPTYQVQVECEYGTNVITDSALLDVVSVTVDGGITYHEAISDAVLGRYIYSWTLPTTKDYVPYTLIAQAHNGWGNVGTSDSVTTYVDTIPPQGATITVPRYTENTSFTISWSATDGSAAVKYDLQYQQDDQSPWTDWLTDTSATSQTFTVLSQVVEEGHDYTFRMLARDIGNNQSEWVTATIRVGHYHVYLPLVLRNYARFVNGDFEAQLAGWSADGSMRVEAVTGLYSGAPPPSVTGAYAARLGGDDSVYSEGHVPVGYGALWQTFSIPDITDPEITIRYRVATRDVVYGTSTQRYFDDFEVAIDQRPWEITDSARDAAGCKQSSPVPSVVDMTNGGLAFCDGNRTGNPTGTAALHDTGWHTVTLRLGPSLRKKNITLYMANFNRVDQYWNTWTYVDEVSVNW